MQPAYDSSVAVADCCAAARAAAFGLPPDGWFSPCAVCRVLTASTVEPNPDWSLPCCRRCQPAFWKAAYNKPVQAPASPTSVLALQGSIGSMGSPAVSQSALGSPDPCRHSGASSSASQWSPADGARLEASRAHVQAQGPPSSDTRGGVQTRAGVPVAAGKTKAARRVQRVLTWEQLLEAAALP